MGTIFLVVFSTEPAILQHRNRLDDPVPVHLPILSHVVIHYRNDHVYSTVTDLSFVTFFIFLKMIEKINKITCCKERLCNKELVQ